MALDERIFEDLGQWHEKLDVQEELLSKVQLDDYYAIFRQQFCPEVLQGLDGEALLEKVHGRRGSRDSLVYWIEFKNDEEFPARFGSISGGNALKFGIYYRNETQTWRTGSPQKQQEISVEEAIDYVRKQRDQLLRGVELLADLPENCTDEDYRTLQERMDEELRDVSNSAWGHKYLSLLYPDKLDDYHNPDYQRYHLIKLLQVPPEGRGRYIVAGRYVALARELGIPMNNLTQILNERDGNPHEYWRIGTSDGTQPRNRWHLMRDGGFVAVGWAELGDLGAYASDQESLDDIKRLMAEKYYQDNPSLASRKGREVHNFSRGISLPDLVLACDGGTVLGVGRVVGDYEFASSSDFPHRRAVEWLSLEEWRLPQAEGLRTTVRRLGQYPENLVAVEERIFGASPLVTPEQKESGTQFALRRLGGIPGRIQAVLERKKQVVLYGPPGTGKTHWAESAARQLAAHHNFGVSYDQLTVPQKERVVGYDGEAKSFVRFCTFHPAYGYEDFLEGYRPETIKGQLVFQRRDGIFKKLCEDARDHPRGHFYLIIDEINRGDIPRIFGELLTVLEADKRERPVALPLTGASFRVPENVYVIGTMNTADRSIALLDTALRRRFGFVELMPESSVLGDTIVGGIPLGPWLDALNASIIDYVGRDARNLQIGHSYLMEDGHPITDLAKLIRVLQEDIIPLLEEYCYEDYAVLENFLGKKLVDASKQRIRYELLDMSKKDELTDALLAPYPDLTTSPQLIAAESEAIDEEENDDSDAADED
jgi:5-methylcytosine-specific restriction enzyme B